MKNCPTCGQSIPDFDDRVERRTQTLFEACEEKGHSVTPDGRVREEVCALFIDRSPETLRNWSYGDPPIPITRVGNRRTYHLSDIAAFMERQK